MVSKPAADAGRRRLAAGILIGEGADRAKASANAAKAPSRAAAKLFGSSAKAKERVPTKTARRLLCGRRKSEFGTLVRTVRMSFNRF
ncbi:hypothetical protein VQ056_07580 [Paenibacillus sp. JTLBN-2024]